jgi:hypothetical protein
MGGGGGGRYVDTKGHIIENSVISPLQLLR